MTANTTMPAAMCMDDMTWTDNGGDNCDWYYSNAGSCGSYGDGAWDSCCACGGGSDGMSGDMTEPATCQDDYSWIDNWLDDCDWYYSNSGSCGSYGEGAYDACCACGGGNGGSAGNSTGEVCQDEMWTDNGGDDCSWYYSNSGSCGSYGDGAWDACCACGGGSGSSGSSTDGTDQCMDDYSWSDNGGDDCDWYYSNAGSCGSYGEGAWDACCACGSGDYDWDYNGYDNEPMDWEWYLDEASDLLPQEGQSWSLGSVTVTYDAASKLVTTFGAVIMATAIAY